MTETTPEGPADGGAEGTPGHAWATAEPTAAPKGPLTVAPRARRACTTVEPMVAPTVAPTTVEPMVAPTRAPTASSTTRPTLPRTTRRRDVSD